MRSRSPPTDSTPCVFPSVILVRGSTALLPVPRSPSALLFNWAVEVLRRAAAHGCTDRYPQAHERPETRGRTHTRPRSSSFLSLSEVLLPFPCVLCLSALSSSSGPAAPLFVAGEAGERACELNLLPLGFLLSRLNLYSRRDPMELNHVGTGHFCLPQRGKAPAAVSALE